MILNPICVRETKPAKLKSELGNVIVDIITGYNDVVNMKDMRGLKDGIEFSDQFEVTPI